jgi:radical SAM superfamily enzyme YgiQ (UPF0313 family)
MPRRARLLLVVKNVSVIERYTPMLLSAILKRAGCDVTFVSAQNHSERSIERLVHNTSPDAYLFSAMTGEHPFLLDMAGRLSRIRNVPAFFGGPHATYCPEELLLRPEVSGVCVGEGDGVVLDLADALAQGADWTGIRNLWVRRDGELIRNELRPLVLDLDGLPFADREIVYAEDPMMRARTTRMFFGMRGCTYACTYCHNHAFNKLCKGLGPVIRERSVGSLLEEMDYVRRKHGMDQVHLDDDTFLLHGSRWLEEFAECYPRDIGLPFLCNVRPELASPDRIRLLAEAGCRTVIIGVECGDEKVRSRLLKRNYTNQQVEDAVNEAKRHGVKVMLLNMAGFPVPDPLAVDEATLELNIRCKPDWAWSSLFYPYPRTQLGQIASREGYLASESDPKDGPETNKTLSLLQWPKEETRREVENLHKFFGLVVEYPWLRGLAKRLSRLPPNIGFELMYYAWYGYCLYGRLEQKRLRPTDALKLLGSLLKYLQRTNRARPEGSTADDQPSGVGRY